MNVFNEMVVQYGNIQIETITKYVALFSSNFSGKQTVTQQQQQQRQRQRQEQQEQQEQQQTNKTFQDSLCCVYFFFIVVNFLFMHVCLFQTYQRR
jgi:hypothetical protein